MQSAASTATMNGLRAGSFRPTKIALWNTSVGIQTGMVDGDGDDDADEQKTIDGETKRKAQSTEHREIMRVCMNMYVCMYHGEQ